MILFNSFRNGLELHRFASGFWEWKKVYFPSFVIDLWF